MSSHPFFPLFAAFLANFILGASSIYWHLFEGIPSIELVVYRVIFSFVILCCVIPLLRWLRLIEKPKITLRLFSIHAIAAVLVAINWGVFIWSSLHGSVLESGLGYLIAPILVMIFGVIFLHENASKIRIWCIIIVMLTLLTLIVTNGRLEHWVYWSIGITWGAYTLLKRKTPLSPISGIFIETAVLIAIILATLFLMKPGFTSPSLSFFNYHPWLLAAGVVSVAPLVMFAFSARKLSAFSMGALQFVLPTTQVAVSALYYRQEVPGTTYICFSVIWVALMMTTIWSSRVTRS